MNQWEKIQDVAASLRSWDSVKKIVAGTKVSKNTLEKVSHWPHGGWTLRTALKVARSLGVCLNDLFDDKLTAAQVVAVTLRRQDADVAIEQLAEYRKAVAVAGAHLVQLAEPRSAVRQGA